MTDTATPRPATPDHHTWEPINVAKPQWACPHCGSTYAADWDAAAACAQLGPAPSVPEGLPVLVLGTGVHPLVFGLTESGDVKRVLGDEDEPPHHERTCTVQQRHLDPELLLATPLGRDGLRTLVPDHRDGDIGVLDSPDLGSYSWPARIFGLQRDLQHGLLDIPVWIERETDREHDWWSTPDQEQRTALNVVTGGLLDLVAAAEDASLERAAREVYRTASHRRHRYSDTLGLGTLLSPDTGLNIAVAHGADNDIWAMRWLSAHLDTVVHWHARALKAWAAGRAADEPSTVSVPATRMPIPAKLPHNPGKRRLAAMAPYGTDYRKVRDVVLEQLRANPPAAPVPGLPDVTTTVRGVAATTADLTERA